MKRTTLRFFAALALAALPVSLTWAGTYTTQSGASYSGDLNRILEGEVTIQAGEERVVVPLADFDASSRAAIDVWASANQHLVDVYTKWDAQPVIKSSAMPQLPQQFHTPDFQGMVSVDLVLDERGQVIHASVNRSTHTELDSPSVDAAKTWLFEPAQIGGKPVKSRLRVPFRFVFTPTPDPAG